MQILSSLSLTLAALLLIDGVLARPEFSAQGYGYHNQHNSRRHVYKKSTRKSNAIGEYSNAKIREFKAARSGLTAPSAPSNLEEPESCTNRDKTCDPSYKYRSIDGTCNNLKRPYWGAAFTALTRLVPAAYDDGFNAPRGGIHSNLPNPRLVSATMHSDLDYPDTALSNMVPQLGQFLDHDMTLAPEADHRCCTSGKSHDDCWDIPVPPNDPFYSQHNQTCLDFTRSTAYCFPGTSGVREQMNSLTTFVDASQVYGSDNHRGSYLRAHTGGRLRANTSNPKFLPSVESIEKDLGEDIEIIGTYAAGDERVNEMPGLTTLHTLLFREHNRLAKEIKQRKPRWSDEQIYQTARRILIAEWQHVVYGEYLPVILGPQTMARYNLTVEPVRYSTYDPDVDPSIIQAFSTAAYRFGHTLINGLIKMMRESSVVNTYLVRDGFFNDSHITSFGGQGYDLILNGLLQQNAQTYDRFVTQELSCFLLREPEDNFGNDLIARNIQRARDHGLQPYQAYRRVCNLSPLTTWRNRPSEISKENWKNLRSLYATPQDIDLFTAGLAETPVPDGVSGPTFNCIKAMQFHNAKFGDRFFYTHRDQVGSFTLDQIAKINERTWGDIICQNSDLTRTPRNVFRPASPSNPWVPCNDPSRKFDIESFLDV